jgi:hypothetical protein
VERDQPDLAAGSETPDGFPAVREVHEIGNRTYVVADVEPLDVTGMRTITVGTLFFLVAGLALLPFLDDLRADDRVWWIWVCVAGFGLGVFGYFYCLRRARHLHGADPEDGS